MKNEKPISTTIYKTFPVLLILLTIYTAAMPKTVSAFAADSSVSKVESGTQDDFDKKFREGRDLIDKEEWARAAEKFGEVIEKYPNAKIADAALYWLAFCHKKQKQFKEAEAALDRLLEKFPASSWASDARVMKLEILPALGRIYSAGAARTLPALTELYSTVSPARAGKETAPGKALEYYEYSATGGFYTAAARPPLDREDEIKIAAFQSLLAADAKRAIETMGEILSSDSKASETLKQEILRVLRSPRRSPVFIATNVYPINTSGVGKEFVPLLRETLVKSFQNETNVKIRKEIINALANTGDQSTDYLKKLYAAENDREVKRAIINSFGGSANGFYAFNTNAAPKRKIEYDILLEIVSTEKDVELRRLAFSNLRRFPGWTSSEQTIEMLERLYDSETDEAFKISIIGAFSDIKQNRATRKLMDIAKSDKSDKLKLEAIYALRNSKDPEVLKFLEDLIK